jgi:hypothetical protein
MRLEECDRTAASGAELRGRAFGRSDRQGAARRTVAFLGLRSRGAPRPASSRRRQSDGRGVRTARRECDRAVDFVRGIGTVAKRSRRSRRPGDRIRRKASVAACSHPASKGTRCRGKPGLGSIGCGAATLVAPAGLASGELRGARLRRYRPCLRFRAGICPLTCELPGSCSEVTGSQCRRC